MLSSFSFADDTVGFLIEGKFDDSLVENLTKRISEKLEHFDRINLYLEDSNIEDFSILALIKEIIFKMEHSKRFYKIALVSDRKWVQLCGKIEGIIMDAEIKNFDSEDRMDAIAWIAQKK
ncbi:SpoIIAA family protein [Cochleicola gelatinilyticus]|uniref:STAS/SEC14 domain-containing protein n=1 Tax=Cochleicola gelatinilyticus TaxID=1763537 RepID=A0A167IKT8_9FLAO|nr:STAS/SEC14 domain-containing protein [Cochleicola gelatinilyticus]OAB79761.1 hypothetical protein ULVI_03175 [Cochleicola gelatinilyticus]